MTNKLSSVLVMTLFLITFCVLATPASAYTVVGNANTQVVKLYFSFYEAGYLAAYPGLAADVVIQEAKLKHIPIQRTKSSISTEIRGHAGLMLSPNIKVPRNGQWRYTHDIANPMDIEMYKEEAWVYWLD
ncbi:MAG: hypothetical protein WC178_02735 [Candidatus Paceibacterota bacterium]